MKRPPRRARRGLARLDLDIGDHDLAPSSTKRSAMPAPMPRAAPMTRALCPFESSAHASFCLIASFTVSSSDGGQNQRPQDHLRIVNRQRHDIHAGLDRREQQHAGIDARQLPDAALEADAADHHGSERRGTACRCRDWRWRPMCGSRAASRQARQWRRPEINVMMIRRSTLMPARNEATGLPPIIMTCRPNGRLGQDECEDDKAEYRHPGDERDREESLDADDAQGRRQILGRAAAGNRIDHAAHLDIGGKRHDEGVHLELAPPASH